MQSCIAVPTSTRQTPALRTESLAWRAHPARQRPLAALLATLAIGTVAVSCGVLGGVFWGALAACVHVLSLNRYFFPSSFIIYEEGVTASYLLGTQHRRWSEVRRFSADRHGAFLSTRSRRSRLDAYRGVHLLFGSRREEIIRRIRSSLPANGDPP